MSEGHIVIIWVVTVAVFGWWITCIGRDVSECKDQLKRIADALEALRESKK